MTAEILIKGRPLRLWRGEGGAPGRFPSKNVEKPLSQYGEAGIFLCNLEESSLRDGSITFSTALDNAQLEKDLDRLEKKILRERELLGGLKIKKNGLEKQLKAASAALDEIKK